MKCYRVTYRTGEKAFSTKEIFVTGETLYKALYDWQVFDILSVELMGDAA